MNSKLICIKYNGFMYNFLATDLSQPHYDDLQVQSILAKNGYYGEKRYILITELSKNQSSTDSFYWQDHPMIKLMVEHIQQNFETISNGEIVQL